MEAADSLFKLWRANYRQEQGTRWKPLKDESVAWVIHNGTKPSVLRVNPNTSKDEINIEALTNSELPPQYSNENLKAALGVLSALRTAARTGETAVAIVDHQ